MKRALLAAALVALVALPAASGKVVNANPDELPPGCEELAGTREVTVHGGREHARHFHGAVFTFDERSLEVPACTKVTATFINEDEIRHQWMVHGAYPEGFFLIEVDGPGRDTGTFITGPSPSSLMVHCGLPQHQQKGMKAEILVDGGQGHVPNIPGVSGIPGDASGGTGAALEGAAAGALGLGDVPTSTLLVSVGFIAVSAAWAWRRQRGRR